MNKKSFVISCSSGKSLWKKGIYLNTKYFTLILYVTNVFTSK